MGLAKYSIAYFSLFVHTFWQHKKQLVILTDNYQKMKNCALIFRAFENFF